SKKLYKLIEISLFIPLFFLPFNYVYIILSMFFFSLFYLIYGFQQKIQANIMVGIITFILFKLFFTFQYVCFDIYKLFIFFLVFIYIYLLFYLIYGFKKKNKENIMFGTITFLLSTFTAYVQYAWEALNKSLFFIIGGLLLFGISFVLERLRRKREQGES